MNKNSSEKSIPSNGHDRYLLQSLLAFSLRQGFRQASSKIVQKMHERGIQLSSIVLWCFNAQSKRFHDLSMNLGSQELPVILEEISNAAGALSISSGRKSPFAKPLNRYKCDADKILMYLCLESLKEEDLAYVIVKLNEKFPPHSTDHKVRSFRNDFVKILSSMDKIRKFVAEKWRPYRDVAFKMLYADAHCVARQLPPTCFDQVGTRHHALFVQAVSIETSDLSRSILSVFNDVKCGEVTESKLLQIMNAIDSQ